MSEVLYLYGFVPDGAPAPPARIAGIAGARVSLLDLGGVGAAVSRVPRREYEPDAVAARMGDLAWVADQGAVHERVVTWFVDHAQIVPVRLLTLYSGPSALEEAVEARREEIVAQLARLQGLREWDLKVGYRADVLKQHLDRVSAEIAALDEAIRTAPPGRRYLLERKREKRVEAEVGRTARRLAGDVLDAARPHARKVRTLALPRDSAELPVVLGAALLVETAREPALQARMAEVRGTLEPVGLRISFTGPWAPYRFLTEAAPGGGPAPEASSHAPGDADGPTGSEPQ